MNFGEFFHMGGYAVFVWSSYGLALLALFLNWFLPRRQHKQNLLKLTRFYRQQTSKEETANDPSP